MAVNPRLFELLAEAEAQPSGAYQDLQAALGAVENIGKGYQRGLDIKENLRKRKLAQSSLRDVLGGQIIPGVPEQISDLPLETLDTLVPISKFQTSVQPKQPGSLDALLTQKVVAGKLTPEQAFSIKNRGSLLRSGFEETPEGLTPVPGGKPAREIQKELQVERSKRRSGIERTEFALDAIDKAFPKINMLSAGVGSLTAGTPLAPATDLRESLRPIIAIIGFDELQRLRDASPTGGALGQVSERENVYLQSVRGSLAQIQRPEQLKENLNNIKESFQRSRLAIEAETPDEEANKVAALIIQSNLPYNEKLARIKGIRARAGY